MNLHMICILSIPLMTAMLPARAAQTCDARSGPNRVALVELYTSEGCSSCPPADRQLSQLDTVPDISAEVVPLALHVGYWDRLGWTDHFAQDRFALRQSWLVHANDHSTVYTPQFFVGGAELRSWSASLPARVRQVHTQPAAASISLHAVFSADNVLTLEAMATAPATNASAVLYLAIAENGLVTKVKSGENTGATLAHNHVVREWLGPFRLSGGSTRVQRAVSLPTSWQRDHLEMIGFVEDEHSGVVLQALRTASCTGV